MAFGYSDSHWWKKSGDSLLVNDNVQTHFKNARRPTGRPTTRPPKKGPHLLFFFVSVAFLASTFICSPIAGFVGETPLEGNESTPSGDFYIVNNPIAKCTAGAEATFGFGAGFAFFFV